MKTWEQIKEIAYEKCQTLGSVYEQRIKFEINEIEKQCATITWTNYYNTDKKFESNPNMLLIPYLLGMVDKDPIPDKDNILNTVKASAVLEYKKKHGNIPSDLIIDPDMPDIDIDCLPEARDPIKEYAIKKYGIGTDDEYGSVCSVGTWTTYKFKSALVDAHSVTAANEEEKKRRKNEALALTTNLPDDVDGLKDDGVSACKGKVIIDDEETECGYIHCAAQCPKCGSTDTDDPTLGKIIKENQNLHDFAILYPDTVKYAAKLVGRIQHMGMHAGALIITDRPLYGNIPLARSSSRDYWLSMWSEGRNPQLSKFGYYKWDILGLKTLKYIYECCKFIHQNRGISFGTKKIYTIKLKDGTEYIYDSGETIETDKGEILIDELYTTIHKQI